MAAEAADRGRRSWPSASDHEVVEHAEVAEVVHIGDRIPSTVPEHAESTVIDCDRCTMRGLGCGDCVVTVLLGGPPFGVELDEVETRAIGVLADAGLVPPLRMADPDEA